MSSARLSSLDHIDLILYTVKVGKFRASSNLLSLMILLLKHCLFSHFKLEDLEEMITGIEHEEAGSDSERMLSSREKLPSYWGICRESHVDICTVVWSSRKDLLTKVSPQISHFTD